MHLNKTDTHEITSLFTACPVLHHQEGKTIKSSSGFSGKGFKFDETEHALANERKKLQKAALGLQDSDDEDGALDVSNVKISLFVI